MSPHNNWRPQCPLEVRETQLKAFQDHCIFLLRQNGPAAYTIQQGRHKPLEVRLGNPHSCTCKDYRKMQELCIHICWVLLRKLQLKPEDSLSYQLGMSVGELNHFLSGKTQIYASASAAKKADSKFKSIDYEAATVPKRLINSHDLCPICLEMFSIRNLPVVYCKHGCGNGVHARCMTVVVKHQLKTAELTTDEHPDTDVHLFILTCPLCRGHFGLNGEFQKEVKRLKMVRRRKKHSEIPAAEHTGLTCGACAVSPILGKAYRCMKCPQLVLCSSCIQNRPFTELHSNHGFACKTRSADNWRPVRVKPGESGRKREESGFKLPCLTEEGADLKELLQSQTKIQVTRSFLLRKQFCGSCTLPFQVLEVAVALNCGHYYHSACLLIDLSTNLTTSCPLDNIKIQPKLRRQNAISRWLPPADDMNPSPKLSSLPSHPDVVQILHPPLEVRVCRMSLAERPRESQASKQSYSHVTLRSKKSSPKPKRKKYKIPKQKIKRESVQLPVIGGVPEVMQRNLGTQIRPLMAVLMTPRPQSTTSNSYDSETSSESEKKNGPHLSVKSLELPEKCAVVIQRSQYGRTPARGRNSIPWRRLGHRSRPETAPPFSVSTTGSSNGLLDAFLLDCAQLSLSPRHD